MSLTFHDKNRNHKGENNETIDYNRIRCRISIAVIFLTHTLFSMKLSYKRNSWNIVKKIFGVVFEFNI